MDDLKKTPLHPCHVELKARMVPFAGYHMPVQYTKVLDETKNVRSNVGLFDVSHMGQVRIKGPMAIAAVNGLVTNQLTRLKDGQAQYNMLCNTSGGVIDDLVVYRISDSEIFICVNASNRRADVEWFKSHLPHTLDFKDESDQTALIAVQGPNAEKLLATGGDKQLIEKLNYYWAANTTLFGKPVFLSRTGYTGEDGFELYVHDQDAVAIWSELLSQGKQFGVAPIGLAARDTLRLEMGYPLHGHELSTSISPIAANLKWVVKLNKPLPFIGQEALQWDHENGPETTLLALVLDDKRIPRTDYPITLPDGTPIGTITSGTMSPHLEKPIALGFVQSEYADADSLCVSIRDQLVPAKVVALPFIPSNIKKKPAA